MPLFQTAIPIKSEEIEKLLKSHWNLKLGKLIKASQNHTFQAFSEDGSKKFSVRVTPDPEKKNIKRVSDQLFFVNYLVKNGLHHICSPVQNLNQDIVLVQGDLIISVFQWARGSPLNFAEFRWMRESSVIKAWGKFFAQMHKISKKFSIQFPEYVQRIQKWDEVHCGTLKGTKIHPEDLAVMNDPQHYGVLHGDLNTSNIFYVDDGDYISAYDTDQVQVGFYLFDIAQACITIVMVEDGGMPISGTAIQGANKSQFIGHMISGYQSEGLKVDRERLDRMIEIKKQLYVKFSIQAQKEGNTPPDMAPFLKYIRDCLQPKWKLQI